MLYNPSLNEIQLYVQKYWCIFRDRSRDFDNRSVRWHGDGDEGVCARDDDNNSIVSHVVGLLGWYIHFFSSITPDIR